MSEPLRSPDSPLTLSGDRSGLALFLWGPSSAGKSTIAAELLAQHFPDFLYLPLDISARIFGQRESLASNSSVERWKDVVKSLQEMLTSLLLRGHNVIVDLVPVDGDQVDRGWLGAVSREAGNDKAVWIHVTADTAVLKKREDERGDRPEGLAEYHLTFSPGCFPMGLTVDTSSLSVAQAAEAIVAYLKIL